MRNNKLSIAYSISLGMSISCSALEPVSIYGAPRDGSAGGPTGVGVEAGVDVEAGGDVNAQGGQSGSYANGGTTNASGSGGEAGSAGGGGRASGGSKGSAGRGGRIGAGGSTGGGGVSSTGGAAPRDGGVDASDERGGSVGPPGSDYDDPVFEPPCVADPGTHIAWDGWEPTTDLVASLIQDGNCCSLYATQPRAQIAATAWSWPPKPDGPPTGWYGWQCFDTVPKIDRMAAVNLSNGMSDVFALGTDENIWVRHEYPGATGRGPWLHVARPSGIQELRDIHAFRRADYRPMLLALSEGAVFMRGRQTDYQYSPFADWQKVGDVSGNRVCGGYAKDGHIEVYVVGRDARLAVWNIGGDGGAFMPILAGVLPFVEIDCANDSDGALSAFAVTSIGELHRIREGNAGVTRIDGRYVGSPFPDGGSSLPDGGSSFAVGTIAVQSARLLTDDTNPFNTFALYSAVGRSIYFSHLPGAPVPSVGGSGNEGGPGIAPVETIEWFDASPVNRWVQPTGSGGSP